MGCDLYAKGSFPLNDYLFFLLNEVCLIGALLAFNYYVWDLVFCLIKVIRLGGVF